MGMPKHEAAVVDFGQTPEIFATHVLPVENGGQFLRLTFCAQHAFGETNGPEIHVAVRVALTPAGFDDLMRRLAAFRDHVLN